ncbi:DUF6146 family protein [Aureisphaera galaxeae]|uniref:DUF6146 family protein n=1 Tax=Aureisphaera galaxeae TaxID=1538023 RepID=UPI002350FFE8|nr:DUF6146 family protein [Aureisphaera galaxeae]MDC8003984.1 DUF6146 family protein [Aureisphaera galaxeae]
MKYFAIILICILTFASCDSSKSVVQKDSEAVAEAANDTVRIANDELEYEIIIIDPGFNSWLVTQYPRGYYGQDFLERKNQQFVIEYNRRVMNFQQFDRNLYQQEINYEFNIDYGYEVNYLLYNYFLYFQQRYNQNLPGSRGISRG